jgi:hypothetical protein
MSQSIKYLYVAALGYQPLRMKPVHFATSFLLCLHQRYRDLELLNKAAHPKIAEKCPGDEYIAENLYPLLKNHEEKIVDDDVSLEDFKLLRNHLNAAFDNDKAAYPRFSPYSTFGCDYSIPSLAYLENQSKSHGNAGAFVWLVLNASEIGQRFLTMAKELVETASGPAAILGAPLLNLEENEYTDQISELCGDLPESRIAEISELMKPQTEALLLLAENIKTRQSPYALRKLIIGLGSWLLVYQIRRIPGAFGTIFFSDFTGETRPRIRAQAAACYARQLGLFGRSLHLWLSLNPEGLIEENDHQLFEKTEVKITKDLEEHFRDFSQRIGWVQPRSNSTQKFFRAVPDTMRVLLLSIMKANEVITLTEIAERLRFRWRLVFGLLPEDHEILRKHGYAPLDEDADLRANREAFIQLAIHLGFAWEPSDGLVLFSLTPDQII